MNSTENNKNPVNYEKRPLWEWVLLYVIIGLILYGLIYYLFVAGSYDDQFQNNSQISTSTKNQEATSSANLLIKTSPIYGNYLATDVGRTLYMYKEDGTGVSNCAGSCTANWRPYTIMVPDALASGKKLSGELSTLTQSDGSLQATYNGKPLYVYISDSKSGDMKGSSMSDSWAVAKP